MREYIRGETVEIYAEVTNQAGSYVDPSTSITVTITDPNDTDQVDTQAMTKSDTGKYVYRYTIDSDGTIGWWKALVIVTDGKKKKKSRTGFRVVE